MVAGPSKTLYGEEEGEDDLEALLQKELDKGPSKVTNTDESSDDEEAENDNEARCSGSLPGSSKEPRSFPPEPPRRQPLTPLDVPPPMTPPLARQPTTPPGAYESQIVSLTKKVFAALEVFLMQNETLKTIQECFKCVLFFMYVAN